MKTKFWMAGIVVFFWAVVIVCFDALYGLNDDLMIQNILSGQFTGTPEGMTVYMAQPLSGFLAALYKVSGSLPWLGLFFVACYAGCFLLVMYRVWNAGNLRRALVGAGLWIVIFCALLLPQYLLIHYTVVAAVVGGCGIFLLMTVPDRERVGAYIVPAVLLVLCFLIRKQVFFMLAPFAAVGLLFRMILHRRWKTEVLFGSCTGAAVLVFLALNALCYGGDWKSYSEFNGSRTRLYDYTGVWEGEAARAYYGSLGITPERLELYLSYDILLDPEVSTELMERMADFKPSEFGIKSPMEVSLDEALWLYINRTTQPGEDFPYNYLVIFLYLLTAVVLFVGGCRAGLLCEVLMGGGRSVIWLYLLMGGRFPERVSVPLYLAETAVLLGMMFCVLNREEERRAVCLRRCVAVVLAAVTALTAAETLPKAVSDQREQIEKNRLADALFDYMEARQQDLYLLDVYAAVGRTEFAVKNYERGSRNYLLLGGWTAGSPLPEKKLAEWGYASASEALLSGEPVYLAVRDGYGMTAEKLEAFFENMTMEQVDEFVVGGEADEAVCFRIYCARRHG